MRYTSEDLMKAMGLKVGDKIFLNNRGIEYEVCFSEWSQNHYLRNNNYCDIWLRDILGEEYEIIQPKLTLTEDEKDKLRKLNKKWKFIARDQWEDNIMVCDAMPHRNLSLKESQGLYFKGEGEWVMLKGDSYEQLRELNHLFKFIKWEDEPYLIEDLLND